ncbi:MAG: hypothetical protein ACYSUX_05420 [Planctomycetota bacterium]
MGKISGGQGRCSQASPGFDPELFGGLRPARPSRKLRVDPCAG